MSTPACIELAEEGMPKVVVAHEMSFAPTVAGRVVCMGVGEIVESAPPEEFSSAPRTERAKLFLSQMLGH
jgi:ABC-type polar amino acid transport system ATPase subunit